MFKRFASFGIGLAVLGFLAAPASARHHQGEKPEPGHHGRGGNRTNAQVQPNDGHGKNRGKDGVNDKKDDRGNDGPNHK